MIATETKTLHFNFEVNQTNSTVFTANFMFCLIIAIPSGSVPPLFYVSS